MYIIFFLMWVIFNGAFTLEIALFGVVIAGVMYAFMCKFMDYSWRKDVRICRCIPLAVQYFFVLLWEIIKANVQTTRIILSHKQDYHPVLKKFHTDLRTKTAKVLLANSITLTPGTITVSLEGDEYVVHCLDQSMAEGMEESVFVKLLRRMENVS